MAFTLASAWARISTFCRHCWSQGTVPLEVAGSWRSSALEAFELFSGF